MGVVKKENYLARLSALSLMLATVTNLYMPAVLANEQGRNTGTSKTAGQMPKAKPNVVYIVLDDMGYSDLGSYGSEIKTPNIDKLANDGLIYNNFNTCPVCSPTRASLLTGRDNHAVGMGSLASVDLGPENPNMRARINDNAATVAQVLKTNGYSTMGVGKWHVAPISTATPAGPFDYWPLAKGFERYYGFLGGETDQYDPVLIYDNHAVDTPKQPGYQFSADMIDKANRFISDQVTVAPDKPFFLYVALGAVHSPHQAPQKYIDMYKGVYDKGWDKIREERFARQKQLGIIPADAQLTERDAKVKTWESLSVDEKKLFARYEETYAGFLTYADEQIGRLIDHLKATGQYDNTIITVISDNGATDSGGEYGTDYDLKAYRAISMTPVELIARKDKIGGPEFRGIYPKGWGMVGNTPFSGYKFGLYNGGTRDPLIVHWPKGIKAKGEIRSQYVHVTDITPTVYDILSIDAPKTFQGVDQLPLDGKSIVDTFADAQAPTKHNVQYYLFQSDRSIYKDGWKAISNHKKGSSFEQDTWKLFNLNEDFSESRDVAAANPEKLKELQALWQKEAKEHGAILKETLFVPTTVRRDVYKAYPGVNQMSSGAGPNTYNKSYTITVPIERDSKSQEGVLVSLGNSSAGYSFFIQNNKLIYQHNYFDKEITRIESNEKLPLGKVDVKYVYTNTGSYTGKGQLFINGKLAGEKVIPHTLFQSSDETFDIGCDRHGIVSASYKDKGEFAFNGKFKYVLFEMQPASQVAK